MLNTVQKSSRRGFDHGADAECSKKWFLKDVLNKITSFDGSLDTNVRFLMPVIKTFVDNKTIVKSSKHE